ncbi:MAG: hypothetical protein QXT45_00100 [Candidatus Bilamarchaeaceae archaeon]
MKRYILAFLVVFMLLIGTIVQKYEHDVLHDGSSVITKSFRLSALGPVNESALKRFCADNLEYGCSIENGEMHVTIALSKQTEYYTLVVDYGFPFVTYDLTIRSVPDDVFAEKIDAIMKANGYAGTGRKEPIDITTKDTEIEAFLKTYGDISYSVKMPGSIVDNNVGKRSDSVVTFAFSEVFKKEGPVIIKSQEINSGYLLLATMAIVIIAFAFTFLKKAPKAEEGPKPLKPKKRKN